MTSLTVEIASVPDREGLIAEIWQQDTMIAEIHRELGPLTIDIYGSESGEPWSLNLQNWIAVLREAEAKLNPARSST